jgi:acylphosphatase
VSKRDRERREVYYSGRVQGVGFRFTVRAIASRYDVVGFVRNLSDGRVQLEVEGEPSEIDRFVQEIQQEMQSYIENVQQIVGDETGRFDSFDIKF